MTRLIRSEVVTMLEAPEYLTVSLPVGTPPDIQGIRIVERARGLVRATSHRVLPERPGPEVWQLELTSTGERPADTDVEAVAEGHIAIVPMRVDEADPALAARLRARLDTIPPWKTEEAGSDPQSER